MSKIDTPYKQNIVNPKVRKNPDLKEKNKERLVSSSDENVQDVLELLEQLCEALKYSHENGIVHRDLKPSNIIISKNTNGAETARLVDFGIAKLLSDQTRDTRPVKLMVAYAYKGLNDDANYSKMMEEARTYGYGQFESWKDELEAKCKRANLEL